MSLKNVLPAFIIFLILDGLICGLIIYDYSIRHDLGLTIFLILLFNIPMLVIIIMIIKIKDHTDDELNIQLV